MSEQTHQLQPIISANERWRVIALIGDKFDRDIEVPLRDLSLGVAFLDIPDDDRLTSSPDIGTSSHYLDYTLDAPTKEIAVARSIVNMFSCLEIIGVTDPSIRFARIGRAATLSMDCEAALGNMYDVTDLAVVSEQEAQHFSDHLIADDFES